jgi:hypothetical protein
VTDQYRTNPLERQGVYFRQVSHVAGRWCAVDGATVAYQAPCRIRPDDERLAVVGEVNQRRFV